MEEQIAEEMRLAEEKKKKEREAKLNKKKR